MNWLDMVLMLSVGVGALMGVWIGLIRSAFAVTIRRGNSTIMDSSAITLLIKGTETSPGASWVASPQGRPSRRHRQATP